MTELELACRDWKANYEQTRIDRHPTVWIGHYDGATPLGSVYATRPKHEADLTITLASPFAISGVPTTFVFYDRPGYIWVGRLHYDGGVRQTFWRIPYGVDDSGRVRFDVAAKTHPPAHIVRAFGELAQYRLTQPVCNEFEVAYWTALEVSRDYERI